MTKKHKSNHNKQNRTQSVDKRTKVNSRYRSAIITTLIALGGIYAAFFILIFVRGGNVVEDVFQAQSLLGGLFVNLFAVIGVAYSKFADYEFVHERVYWLSLSAFVILISIYAQAGAMQDSSIRVVADWMKSPWTSVVLQILLAILIFKLAAQKELEVKVDYKKKKIY